MKNLHLGSLTSLFFMGAVFITSSTAAAGLTDSVPRGWMSSKAVSPGTVIGIDTIIKHSGKASVFLQRPDSVLYGSSGLRQAIAAEPYRNKNVRLTVHVKSKEVARAVLHFNVVGTDSLLTFANFFIEPTEENMDWTLSRITLDVPEESQYMLFGVGLYGWGTIWLDDFKLDIVDKSVPSDDMIISGKLVTRSPAEKIPLNAAAMNLGFEEW